MQRACEPDELAKAAKAAEDRRARAGDESRAAGELAEAIAAELTAGASSW